MDRKIVNISTCTMGDNVTSEQCVITTVLYDDGVIYQGTNERTGGNHNDGYQWGMAWCRIQTPDEQN